jgi:sugar lactone lactonase YvrE
VALGLGALVVADAGAVTTRSFNTSTYKEFDEGDGENVFISSLGEVMPGAATDRLGFENDAVWTAVRGGDGTVYAGTIDKGHVLAVSGGKSKVLASLEKDTPWIGALALDGAGKTLYVGTVATGSVWSVDVKTGAAALVVKLDGVDHVWALEWSGDGKTLYAATGSEGKLWAVDPAAKKAKLAWDSGQTHLLSMARAKDGALWLGTADEAVLYRWDPRSGQARAVADFAGTEIKALVELDGAWVVAVNDFEAKAGSAPAKKPQPKGTVAKAPEPGSAPGADKAAGADAQPRPGERKGRGALFRVEADGRLEQLHALADGYFTALAVDGGDVLGATGAQGRVYRVRDDRTVLTAFDVPERQVTALMSGKGGIAFTTGDSAALYVASGSPKKASYTSKVLDASASARWGSLRWRGEGALVIETRSGNTAKPDKGWSGWEKVTAPKRGGGDTTTALVPSPTGRYLQYRVRFEGPGTLRQVTVYYLPQNQRARVTDVTVGEGGGGAPVTLAGGATKPRSPVVKVKWKVENPDGDELDYDVEVRPEGDSEWRPVPTGPAGEPYNKTDLDWNTEALPDGWYRLRVSASDARANPRDYALSSAYVSQPFLVDNSRPQVSGLEVKYPNAAARATDAFSRIDEIAYSVDGGDWIMAYPKDGIFDDVSEAFAIKLPDGLAPGAHTLSIRVADEADNIGAASVTFRVGK